MSDYIFNCFKEHVTTGLVCSLSAGATDALTEWKGHRRSVTESASACLGFTLQHTVLWHMYTFIQKMAD